MSFNNQIKHDLKNNFNSELSNKVLEENTDKNVEQEDNLNKSSMDISKDIHSPIAKGLHINRKSKIKKILNFTNEEEVLINNNNDEINVEVIESQSEVFNDKYNNNNNQENISNTNNNEYNSNNNSQANNKLSSIQLDEFSNTKKPNIFDKNYYIETSDFNLKNNGIINNNNNKKDKENSQINLNISINYNCLTNNDINNNTYNCKSINNFNSDNNINQRIADFSFSNKDDITTKQIINSNNNNNYSNNTVITKDDPRLKQQFVINNNLKMHNSSEYRGYMFKVIMLGNIAVGKTCLLSYFVDNTFKSEYSCTVGVDFKVKTIVLNPSVKVDLQIWDTSGEERFKTITRQYYRDAAGIALVFDVCNEKSFKDCVLWIEDIRLVAKRNVNIILIGNKTDLSTKRCVSYEVARRYAENNNIEYYESSAKTGHQVNGIFERLAGNMVNTLEEEDNNNNNNNCSKDNISLNNNSSVKNKYYNNENEVEITASELMNHSKFNKNKRNKSKNCC